MIRLKKKKNSQSLPKQTQADSNFTSGLVASTPNSGIIPTPLQNKSSDKTTVSKSAQKLPTTHNSDYSLEVMMMRDRKKLKCIKIAFEDYKRALADRKKLKKGAPCI